MRKITFLLIRYRYMYMDKITTTQKAIFIVASPVHIVLPKIRLQFHRYLIDHEHAFVDLCPVFKQATTKHSNEHDKSVPNLSDERTLVFPLQDWLPTSIRK